MQFKDIQGHEQTKSRLIQTVKENRISHAQLFLGPEGCGKLALAIAYAQYISCPERTETDSCGVCPQCQKYQKLIHPDLHFVYPVVKLKTGDTHPVSDNFIDSWRGFVLKRNYHRLDDWYDYIGSDNAQGAIFAQESQEIIRKLSLKTFEGEYKIMVIWMPEKMNETCANKLLKMIEEPPPKTLFLLVSENEEQILTTIRSRTQLIKINRPEDSDIVASLAKEFPEAAATNIESAATLANGNYLAALEVLEQLHDGGEPPEFSLFTTLMRESYSLKYDQIIKLSETLSKLGREKQKQFFDYCQRMVRECFMLSSADRSLVRMTPAEMGFAQKFAQFVHIGNVSQIASLLTDACANIERNAYGKLVFTDTAIKLSSLLRMKRAA
ncbi:MAG: DNA polymerase III subunit delta [Bacteroidales bacterium]|nr:DNA polymerase III subunit delta [Bacteroidales bacterium]